jgi:hypothetical protein
MLKLLKRTRKPQNWVIVTFFFVMAILSAFLSVVIGGSVIDRTWIADLFKGLTSEMIGAAAAFMMVEWTLGDFKEARQEEQEKARLKAQLIRQMGSRINTEAIRAVEELRAHGWLTDGSLRGKSLEFANLEEADLSYADLRDTNLTRANLRGASLRDATLSGAKLTKTDLRDVDIALVDLRGLDFSYCNLAGARLVGVTVDETTEFSIGKWNNQMEDAQLTRDLGLSSFYRHL